MKLCSRILLLMPVSALFLSACEIKRDAKSMMKTTRRVEDGTRHLEKRTDDLHGDMTYKESDDVLTQRLEKLFGERASDNLGPVVGTYEFFFGLKDEPDLCKAAEVAIRAMHWQFWKGDYADTLEELDGRFQLALKSMFVSLFKHIPRDGQVDVLRPDRSYRGVAAMGSALDAVSDSFHKTLVAKGLPDTVFYDLIVEALRNRNSFVRNEKFPRAAAEVLRWEQEAIYLLQLRHNALPLMVLTRMTDFQERGDVRRLWMSITGQNVSLNSVNPEKLKEWSLWLDKAAKTRADLVGIGVQPLYNGIMAKLLAGVDFGQKTILARPLSAVQDERAQLEVRFAQTYVNVVGQASKPKARAPRISTTLGGG